MADATKFPTLAELTYFQWSRPDAPNPRLSAPISATDTLISFTSAPEDENGTIITTPFLMGIKNDESYTELIYCPNGADGVDGLSATGCVRGVRIAGIDFTTGDSTFATSHGQDNPVFCPVSSVMQAVMVEAVQGTLATGGSDFIIGTDATGTVTVSRSSGVGTFLGWIRWNTSNTKVEFSNDGAIWTAIDAVVASTLVAVTGADTTPGFLDDKIISSSGRITTTVASPGADEDLDFDLAMTATDAEIDQALSGIGVTVTAANLDTLTDGSNADALHTHLTSAVDVTTAEAIDGSTTPQAISILGNSFRDMLLIPASSQTVLSTNTGTARLFGDADASTRRAQSFIITDAEATSIVLDELTILLTKIGAPGDNVTIEIQGDSAGAPDDIPITNGTSVAIAGGSISTVEQPVKFTWSTPPTLVSGTTYWAVIRRSGANDGVNHYQWRDSGANNYADGTGSTYTASTMLWSNLTNDFQLIMLLTADYDGDVIRSKANESRRGNFAGFTKSNVGAGATAELVGENYIDGFSGLDIGAIYFVDTTEGAITATPPTVGGGISDPNVQIRAGIAVTATTLEIQKDFTRIVDLALVFSSGQPISQITSGTAFIDVFFDCGFRPSDFYIRYSRNNVSGVGGDDRYVWKRVIGTNEFDSQFIEPVPFGSIGDIDVTTNDIGVQVQSIEENGFVARFNTEDLNEDIVDLVMLVKP